MLLRLHLDQRLRTVSRDPLCSRQIAGTAGHQIFMRAAREGGPSKSVAILHFSSCDPQKVGQKASRKLQCLRHPSIFFRVGTWSSDADPIPQPPPINCERTERTDNFYPVTRLGSMRMYFTAQRHWQRNFDR